MPFKSSACRSENQHQTVRAFAAFGVDYCTGQLGELSSNQPMSFDFFSVLLQNNCADDCVVAIDRLANESILAFQKTCEEFVTIVIIMCKS